VGTVKTHLNNIYRKLNARSRTQAVARARELDLI
jgi:ATP/maltotriose-dependent transcriptional regulator MalT